MVLAINPTVLYIIFLIIVLIVAAFPINKAIKTSNRTKKESADRMSDLNAFILQYEAAKAKAKEDNEVYEKEQAEKDIANTVASPEDLKLPDAETIGRIKALVLDAGMSKEAVAEKTGVSVEVINRIL